MVTTANRVLSRRNALLRLGSGGLTATLAARGISSVAAHDATPAAGMNGIPPLLQEWAAAWSAQDPLRVVALYTDDALYEDVPSDTTASGHGEIEALARAFFAVIGDFSLALVSGFGTATWAVAEWILTGTDLGLLPLLVPGATATGVAFEVRGVAITELDGGKIRRSADYYDLLTIVRQLERASGTPSP